MLKTCYIFFILSLSSATALGQQEKIYQLPEPKRFISKVEIFAGPSIVGVHGNTDYEKYGVTKIGYIGGVSVSHVVSKRFDLDFKISYERKGSSQRVYAMYPPDIYNNPPSSVLPPVKTTIDGTIDNSYLVFLLIPKVLFGRDNKVHFGTGAYYGKSMKSQATIIDTQDGQVKRKFTVDQSDTYKDFDFWVSSSLGYKFCSNRNFILGSQLLFSYGLVNVVNLQPVLLPTKNHSLSLLVSISFR